MPLAQSPSVSSRPSRAELRGGRLASAIDHPSMEPFRRAGARRRLVILHLLLTALLVTVPQLLFLWHGQDGAMPLWGFAVAAVVLFLPWVFVTGMVNGSVYGIFDLSDAQLDEVERQHRDAAYRTAYRAMIPVTMVSIGAVAGLVESGRTALAFWLGSLFLFLLLGLPQYIAAWRFAARPSTDGLTVGADA
ncbi:MAG: hypothetical protein RL139_1143 [Gemmatimonadota bacterium]|jgi:hypothetical protein